MWKMASGEAAAVGLALSGGSPPTSAPEDGGDSVKPLAAEGMGGTSSTLSGCWTNQRGGIDKEEQFAGSVRRWFRQAGAAAVACGPSAGLDLGRVNPGNLLHAIKPENRGKKAG